MDQFLSRILDTEGFPPRWYCGTAWTPELGWTHIISDITIFAAYTMIPLILAFFVFVRKDFPFQTVFILFVVFIFLCGISHLVEASIFWEPWYRLSALVKVLTAVVSVFTAIALVFFIPKILRLPRFINMQLQAVLENAPDAIIITDEKGRIQMYNPAAEQLFQYNPKEIIGKNINCLIPDSTQNSLEAYINSIQHEDGKPEREINLLSKNKKPIPTEVSSSDVELEGSRSKIHIIRDISARKRHDEEIIQYTEELKRSNKELDAFAYVASHDLKAPLRGIGVLSELVHKDCHDLIPESSRDHLKKIQGRVKRMEGLLNSLLSYARIGRKKIASEPVDCHQIIQGIIEEAEAPKDFNFELPKDMPSLHTQKSSFYQVMQNLITNSIRYRSPERPGKVQIEWADLGNFIQISVKDNGLGIPKQYHSKVFQMFQRLHVSDEIEGSGIGLAVVKKIIETMGGKISIDPNTEVGTRMVFTWPKTV